jgi:diacylglycerol kinase family enzyme
VSDSPGETAVERMLASLAPIGEADKRRALVIVNPFATTVSDRLRNLVVYALAARYQVEAIETQSRGHATEICRQAARDGYGVVIAFGGDGTVNEAANGLASCGTPLTCLPGGSANVFCKLLGIPGEIVDATEHLLRMADRFAPRQVDLGLVEGRHYTFSAGVGIDADVVRRVDGRPALKRRFGPWFFTAVAGAVVVRSYLVRPPRMLVETAAGTFAGVTAIVQNGEHYTYFHDRPVDLADGVALDGGALAGVVLERASVVGLGTLAVRALLPGARVTRHRRITSFRGSSPVTISTADGRPLPLQVDGDYLGEVTEARFQVRPRALTVAA